MRYPGLKQTTFELITIGYEILDGKILNTNSKWLAENITSMGGRVTRMITVGDEVDEIASVIRDALRRGINWIITSGGLGPTYDDLTLQGVAKAVRRKLVLNKKVLEMIRERYKVLAEEGVVSSPELTPPRIKMAMLPRGAKPLRNDVGSAPGVLLRSGKTRIACLPGVPKELYSIFEKELKPLIEKSIKKVYRIEKWIKVLNVPESSLAPKIDDVRGEVSGIYIKSHPKSAEGVSRIELQVVAVANRVEVAEKRLAKAVNLLEKAVLELGGNIKEAPRNSVEGWEDSSK